MKRRWLTRSPDETQAVGESLGHELRPAGVLLLAGDLGAGKTVLTQGVARALGIAASEVQSPTFTLIREHQGSGGRLTHVDLYRLDDAAVSALGVGEILAGPGVKVVEWAERLGAETPPGALRVRLDRRADDQREIQEE